MSHTLNQQDVQESFETQLELHIQMLPGVSKWIIITLTGIITHHLLRLKNGGQMHLPASSD
jgi:ribosomal protein S17E